MGRAKKQIDPDPESKTPHPQFTESIAMIMEQFKHPSDESKLKKILTKLLKYLAISSLFALIIYLGYSSIESVSLTNSGNSTQLIINYKP